MTIKVSQRVSNIKPSATLAVSARAAKLRAAGQDIISLSAGEPDFDTPEHIKLAAVEALKEGFTKYTDVAGMPGLIEAIIGKFKRENELEYIEKQILVSCGCKHSLYNMVQALINPGDEVVIPAPYWTSYPDMVRLAGGEPVIIKTGIEQGFRISPAQLQGAITDNTRLIILNSPSNPTGACYSRKELAELGKVILEYPDIVVATDDIYEHILWGQEEFVNILNACPDLKERTIVCNGVSKAYSMTGWRIGYAAGPEMLVGAMKNIQSQSTSNPTSIAQVAAKAALDGDQSYIEKSTAVFKERHDFVYDQLNEIDGVSCMASEGTFYIFPDMSAVIDKLKDINDDIQFGEFLLEKAGIAIVPGSAFGAPGCIRISFATSMDNLVESMKRLKEALG
ncbi:MAG TPA: pyridoxal phosphate-dependent aminotransferase [Gammaproteobacteria bacterium]|nr:pyridoxal phosphate-dependent aminotransferase [Gammaproteobacteria bacterium]